MQILLRQKEEPCKEADERVHGVGSSCQEETGGPVPSAAQRPAQQDLGSALEVSAPSTNTQSDPFVVLTMIGVVKTVRDTAKLK